MVTITKIALAIAATLIAGTDAFKNPCRLPYDQCGWVLANNDFGYTYAELSAAANSTIGTNIYDALYSCEENGAITYIQWCGGASKCETGIVPNDNCKA